MCKLCSAMNAVLAPMELWAKGWRFWNVLSGDRDGAASPKLESMLPMMIAMGGGFLIILKKTNDLSGTANFIIAFGAAGLAVKLVAML